MRVWLLMARVVAVVIVKQDEQSWRRDLAGDEDDCDKWMKTVGTKVKSDHWSTMADDSDEDEVDEDGWRERL